LAKIDVIQSTDFAEQGHSPENVRGNIARIYKYMEAEYPGHGIISRKNHKLFEAWNKHDKVDSWECV
jgi:deoxyribonuclease-1